MPGQRPPQRWASNTECDDQNIIGALIFISYIIAALLFSGCILVNLWKASFRSTPSPGPKHTQRILAFSSLALFSFTTLSYHMLSFLISSYDDWANARNLPRPAALSAQDLGQLYLWQWTKTSALFQDFATNICMETNGNWWWTEHVLVFSIAWNVYMAVEGTCRQIPNLWLYFALEQILPVSFTMNLFFLAVLLSPSPSDRLAASSGWLVPPVVNQVLMLTVYFAALCIAPSAPTTLALTPVALLIRILLCFPYLGCRPKQPGCRERKISPSKVLGERTPDYKLWVAYKPIWMTIVICYTLLQLLHVWRGSVIAFPPTKDIMWAINNDFAISALGYDLLIAMTSLIVWYGTRPTGKIDGE